jgi:DNA replication protein DnaC
MGDTGDIQGEIRNFQSNITTIAHEIGRRECPACGVEMRHHDQEQITDCFEKTQMVDKIPTMILTAQGLGLVSRRFGKDTFGSSRADADDINAEAIAQCRGWIAGKNKGLYLWGAPGTGKTFVARAILYQAMRLDLSVMEITAYDMLEISTRYDRDMFRELLQKSDYLLIDDIDKPDWNSKNLSYLWSLLNARCEEPIGRTIITSNYDSIGLRSLFAGNGNQSKINATLERMAPTMEIEFKGESWRGRNV